MHRGYVVVKGHDFKIFDDTIEFALHVEAIGLSPIRGLQVDYVIRIGIADGETIFRSDFGMNGRTATLHPPVDLRAGECRSLTRIVKLSQFCGQVPNVSDLAMQPNIFIQYTDVFNRCIIQRQHWSASQERKMRLHSTGSIYIDKRHRSKLEQRVKP